MGGDEVRDNMTVYIVFVKFNIPGVSSSSYGVRYVDSQWAEKSHAYTRKAELEHSLAMGKVPEFTIEIRTGVVADVSITPKKEDEDAS
jgi:hypothetical protein